MLELKIPDMTCGGCAASITRVVKALDAAATVDADLAAHTVRIGSGAAPSALVKAIEVAGFHPETV
ncbi:MAG TPA: heavy-metal-associated domain-containing protein [Usitatibacteraceae bacterium]|nr:heavy-metal-associated domain-containing protein [Usitatibacteraceae bacterium]